MFYEGMVECWWVDDGYKCLIHKANYSRDTRNGIEALMCLHHFMPGERHTYIIGGVTGMMFETEWTHRHTEVLINP